MALSDHTDIEYRVVANDRHRGKSITAALNEAAAEGWRYVDTIAVRKYDSGTDYSILMRRALDGGGES